MMIEQRIAVGSRMRADRPEVSAFAITCVMQGNDTHVARHPMIVDGLGGVRLEPGQSLTVGDLSRFLKMLQGHNARDAIDLSWHNTRILASGPDILCWYAPPAIKPMHFQMLCAKSLSAVPWPGLVFVARGASLSIAAFEGEIVPSPETPLFHAPLMNVYDSSQVCLGSATKPTVNNEESIPVWEDAIYRTNFSHVNHPHTLATGKRSRDVSSATHYRFWASLAKKNAKSFPAEKLLAMKINLEGFVRG